MKQFAEKVSTGGLTGQGFSNLLGRPKLAPLTLVLREAVQNSWDARRRRRSASLRFGVRVRTLNAAQDREFRRIFNQDESLEQYANNTLARQLANPRPVRVLELSDFGTIGLGGTTRPDLPTGGSESRFVNFFFDVGKSHEEGGDGGTYGFGRSSLYTAGKAALIVVDSLVEDGSGEERRMMACRIGHNFEVSSGAKKGRYSGRHFWGREKDGVTQPLLDGSAERIADSLGMPARGGEGGTGTTIVIPWPVETFDSGPEIARTLLHHLWPKMVPAEGQPTIVFEVQVDGQRFPVQDPATSEEYRLFVRALKRARTRNEAAGARAISTLRPRHRTGFLGLEQGILNLPPKPTVSTEAEEEEDEEAEIQAVNQVALMRPSELVVKYLPVSGCEQLGKSWAGVFICEDSPFVRTAFARSEPPAHDDWISNRLEERHEKYIVHKTVHSLLPEAVRDALGVSVLGSVDEPAGGPSLGGVSARFSSMFLAGDGPGAALAPGGNGASNPVGNGGRVGGSRLRISVPRPSGLEMRGGQRVAKFVMTVQGEPGIRGTIRAVPSIHADGALDAPPEGMPAPIVVGWTGGTGSGDSCVVRMDRPQKDIEVFVTINDEYGVVLECVLEDRSQ